MKRHRARGTGKRTVGGMKKVNGRMGEWENGRMGEWGTKKSTGHGGQRQVLQVMQVTYNEDLTLKDTKHLTLSLLLLFTPFPSRPVPIAPDSYRDGSYRELPAFTHPLSLPIFIGIPQRGKASSNGSYCSICLSNIACRYVITML